MPTIKFSSHIDGSFDTSDWKNRRNGPARPPRPSDGSKSIMLTATQQWMDIFTANEQDILTEVEPIMLSIRRIMNQQRLQSTTAFKIADACMLYPLMAKNRTFLTESVWKTW